MTLHIDYDDPKFAAAAAEILQRHNNGEPEANITSAVRDFLIATGLASPSEIGEENPPAQGSRSAVDLTALDTFIESKRRIGTGIDPNPEYVQQLDDYLAQLAALRSARGQGVGVTIARRELRAWLRGSAAGARVEAGVGRRLGGGQGLL